MGIQSIEGEKCTGCQLCVECCPMDVIRFDEVRAKAFIAYGKDCGVCFQCADACPVDAVKVSPESPRPPILPY